MDNHNEEDKIIEDQDAPPEERKVKNKIKKEKTKREILHCL